VIRSLVKRQAARHPSLAVAAAGLAGRLRGAGTGDDFALRRVFPDFDEGQLRATRREARTRQLKSHALDLALAAPGAVWPYPPVEAEIDASTLKPPAVLVTVHVNALHAIGAFLESLGAPVTVLQHAGYFQRPGISGVGVEADEVHRAAALWRGVQALRANGFVFLSLDGLGANAVSATVLDRPVWFTRGAFALSRLTGAPVVPVAPRWRGSRIEVAVGEPIPTADETRMAGQVADWVSDFLRASPGEIGPMTLGLLGAA
jgi:hypothetical protein